MQLKAVEGPTLSLESAFLLRTSCRCLFVAYLPRSWF